MKNVIIPLLALCFIACNNNDDSNSQQDQDMQLILPDVAATFDWQLDDVTSNNVFTADVIDVDAFSTSAATVQHFKDQGKIVIAYLSVGSVENFREDASMFPPEVIGNVYEGFEDENWLDITNFETFAPIMIARLDMIKEKGFDGVEPDNINGYQNETGFNITEAQAIAYCRWLIEEAHSRDLHIGQKNAEELVTELVDEFDWMLIEDAYADEFSDMALPYISSGKAVFVTEYTDRISPTNFTLNVCPNATTNKFSAILKDRDLTQPKLGCN